MPHTAHLASRGPLGGDDEEGLGGIGMVTRSMTVCWRSGLRYPRWQEGDKGPGSTLLAPVQPAWRGHRLCWYPALPSPWFPILPPSPDPSPHCHPESSTTPIART